MSFLAFKNLSSQVEDVVEKTKKEVEELALEKKKAAESMLEQQAKKTGEALWNTKAEVEKTAVGAALDAKKAAIDGFDKECASAEKSADGAVKEVCIKCMKEKHGFSKRTVSYYNYTDIVTRTRMIGRKHVHF